MKQSLNLKIAQQLSLTPQLKQSLKLLQLSSLDLEQEIQQTLDNNPLLERLENEPGNSTEVLETSEPRTNDIPQPIAEAVDPSVEIARSDHLEPEQKLDTNWQETFSNRQTESRNTTADTTAISPEFTHFASKPETLNEHLSWQIQMTALSERDKSIADALLHCMDDEGYLTAELTEVAEYFPADLEIEEDEIHAVLSLIKTLDPVGVGAADLQERLSLLLAQLDPQTPGLALADDIIAQHLDLLASRNYARLRKELGISESQLATSLALITQLNPRIANTFKSDNLDHVVPDVIVVREGQGWQAQLNPDNQCKLRINETYSELLKSNIDSQSSDYIQENLNQAKMFIKGLMSRYDTLLLVAQTIVAEQQAFFEHGEERMQPMVLQDIAERLEMHESTISRATSGKYLLSPRGVYELKFFFSSALTGSDGTATSSTAIRSLIKKMVDAEVKTKPLSDSKIAKELAGQGHIVARRTVAKYRESMQIAPSSQRKSLH